MRMTRMALLAGAMLAGFMAIGAADASNYNNDNVFWRYPKGRWCLNNQDLATTDCNYPTQQACNTLRIGTGGYCYENPNYVERSDARPKKRARRVYR
jgi:hypothetical protein